MWERLNLAAYFRPAARRRPRSTGVGMCTHLTEGVTHKVARPFRFGGCHFGAGSAAEWADGARRIESLGYDTLVTADHFMPGLLAPGPAIVAAALATRTIRLGVQVFANDFHHPAVL